MRVKFILVGYYFEGWLFAGIKGGELELPYYEFRRGFTTWNRSHRYWLFINKGCDVGRFRIARVE